MCWLGLFVRTLRLLDKLNIFLIFMVLTRMLLLSMKTNNKIVQTDDRTDGQVVCKIVFSITFNVSFWCSKGPSHCLNSFEHQKCLSENIIFDLFIYSFIYLSLFTHCIKTNIKTKHKKAGQGRPPTKCHLNGVLLADRYWSDIVCWLGLFVRTFRRLDKLNIFLIFMVLTRMLLLSMKTNNKIVQTDDRTDGQVVCKIVFSITFNVSFWCSKGPSHCLNSFEHQKCLSENIIFDLFIYSFIYLSLFTHCIKTNIKTKHKKAGQGWPASEMPFECHFVGRLMWV